MDFKTFLENFDTIAQAPNGIAKLRSLILDLAVQGKLVHQNSEDEPADQLFEKIQESRETLYSKKRATKKKEFLPLDFDEIPFPIPKNWKWTKLHELCWLITDGTHHTPTYVESGIPFLSVKDLSGGYLDFSSTRFITRETHEELCTRCKPEYGDILLTKVGTTGIAVEIDTTQEFSIFVSVALLKHFPIFTYPKFLTHLLNSSFVKAQSKAGTEGVGNKNLVLRKIYNFVVPLPPLAEQKRIVEKVDELMALCDRLQTSQETRDNLRQKLRESAIDSLMNAETDEELQKSWTIVRDNWHTLSQKPEDVDDLRQVVIQLAVEGKLVDQAPDDEPASFIVKRALEERANLIAAKKISKREAQPPVEETELPFKLSKGWECIRLGEITDIVSGVTKGRKLAGKETAVNPYLRVANVQRWHLDLEVMKEIEILVEELDKYRLQIGDVLLTEGGDWDKLGRSAIWKGEIEDCIHQNHVFRARSLDNGLSPEWIVMFTNSLPGRKYFESAAKRTTNLASINMTQLRFCQLPIPPEEEQKRIVAKVDELMQMCDQLEESLRQSQQRVEALAASAISHLTI